jgi:Calcineurin-like phosphoesterase
MNSQGGGPVRERRQLHDLKDLPRSAALSQLREAAEAASPPNYPPEALFAPASLWNWMRAYLAYVFHRKHYFPAHTASPSHALYDLTGERGSDRVRVSIAGDWGTGTSEAQSVARQMTRFEPHFTIHMGDVYYVGDPLSVNENCLGIKNPNNNYDPVTWPLGSVGSFALNGNHEMYANGGGYFDVFLPRLGLRTSGGVTGQQTSFFCLENQHWRVIAVDTGYNSIGVPILSGIPWINSIPGIGGDCELPAPLVQWVKEVVRPGEDRRGLILLSHHQNYSGFQDQYAKPARQLWKAGVQKRVLWFWGHEHRLAGYDVHGTESLKSYGRCVGHGGMPVELGTPIREPRPLFYDNRRGAHGFGVNGHVNLTFAGPRVECSYVDLDGNVLVEETFSVVDGNVELVRQRQLVQDAEFYWVDEKDFNRNAR